MTGSALLVDGARPAVSAVAELPRSYRLTDADRLVLFALACDSYDGQLSAPGYDQLAAWTGLLRSTVGEVLRRLCEPTERRPALLERAHSTRGGRRTEWRLLFADRPATPDGQDDANRPVPADGHRPATPDGVEQANRPVNRPVPPDGDRPVNRPVGPDTPLPVTPNPPYPPSAPASPWTTALVSPTGTGTRASSAAPVDDEAMADPVAALRDGRWHAARDVLAAAGDVPEQLLDAAADFARADQSTRTSPAKRCEQSAYRQLVVDQVGRQARRRRQTGEVDDQCARLLRRLEQAGEAGQEALNEARYALGVPEDDVTLRTLRAAVQELNDRTEAVAS